MLSRLVLRVDTRDNIVKKTVFSIGGVEVKPGEQKTVELPMPELYDCTPMNMPVHVIRGKKPGPILCVTAALHGDEINGVEIIRRLLKKRLLKNLQGTLIAVPIVNVYGFLYQDRYLLDRRDLNRCFPGSEKGSLAARLAHLILNEVVIKADYFIDLHTGSNHRANLPQVRTNLDIPDNRKIATRFGAPVVLHSKELSGSLREAVTLKGGNFIVYEAGEAFRFDEISIRIGLKGIQNVMRYLKMLPVTSKKERTYQSAVTLSSYWIRSPYSGIMHPMKSLGKKVAANEVLAIISNPTGKQEYKVIADQPGIIIGKSHLPLVHEGAALFHVASFTQPKQVESDIKEIQISHEDGSLDDNSELIGAE